MTMALSIFDMIKKGVVENFSSGVTMLQMLVSIAAAFGLGLFILFIYRITFRGVIFSKGFAYSLVLLAMVTALIIRTISSSLALSLGMVGALSIVRFRTAVKDPVDTIFMFWAISSGIMMGAGIYLVGAVACGATGGLYYLITLIMKKKASPYLLIIRYDPNYVKNVKWILSKLPTYKIKSKTVTKTGAEIAVELNIDDKTSRLVDSILEVDGINDASLVSYEGEFGL
ncbi:MAG: DUF4956 domain-containing protein [Clostridiales bacterium]|nr:DUF4956 domain-containing protein [Clostridiales bacterium]